MCVRENVKEFVSMGVRIRVCSVCAYVCKKMTACLRVTKRANHDRMVLADTLSTDGASGCCNYCNAIIIHAIITLL